MDWMSKNVTVIKIESIIGSFGLKIVQFKPDTLEKVLSAKLVRYKCFLAYCSWYAVWWDWGNVAYEEVCTSKTMRILKCQ